MWSSWPKGFMYNSWKMYQAFSKEVYSETTMHMDFHSLYKRLDNGWYIIKNQIHLDNRWCLTNCLLLL
ncbi:hypothetical protein LINGRAHAP2_LOCUS30571 [Linum grandiflorum]